MSETKAQQELVQLSDVPLASQVHQRRRMEELEWVRANGWAESILAARAEVEAARASGVAVGPAMGSTHASLLLWCVGLTEFDPVAYGLAPSTFYRAGGRPPSHQARWYASEDPKRGARLQFDPLVAALANVPGTMEGLVAKHRKPVTSFEPAAFGRLAESWCTIDPDHIEPPYPAARGPWTFDRYPNARWILAHGHARGFEDLVCACSLARPGPAGCGMLQAYLSAPDEGGAAVLPEILGISRGVVVFREQLHAIGSLLLGLDIDGTTRFAKDVVAGSHDEWEERLRDALVMNGATSEQAEELWTRFANWSPFLFPLAHALGRAWLLALWASYCVPVEPS